LSALNSQVKWTNSSVKTLVRAKACGTPSVLTDCTHCARDQRSSPCVRCKNGTTDGSSGIYASPKNARVSRPDSSIRFSQKSKNPYGSMRMNNRMEYSPRIRGGPAPVKTLGSLQGLLLLRRVGK